jgi:hypothetical protein
MAFLIHIVEWMFIIGVIGSAVVILLTTIEDVETLLEPDEPPAVPGAEAQEPPSD